jgi:hypothetical protein
MIVMWEWWQWLFFVLATIVLLTWRRYDQFVDETRRRMVWMDATQCWAREWHWRHTGGVFWWYVTSNFALWRRHCELSFQAYAFLCGAVLVPDADESTALQTAYWLRPFNPWPVPFDWQVHVVITAHRIRVLGLRYNADAPRLYWQVGHLHLKLMNRALAHLSPRESIDKVLSFVLFMRIGMDHIIEQQNAIV